MTDRKYIASNYAEGILGQVRRQEASHAGMPMIKIFASIAGYQAGLYLTPRESAHLTRLLSNDCEPKKNADLMRDGDLQAANLNSELRKIGILINTLSHNELGELMPTKCTSAESGTFYTQLTDPKQIIDLNPKPKKFRETPKLFDLLAPDEQMLQALVGNEFAKAIHRDSSLRNSIAENYHTLKSYQRPDARRLLAPITPCLSCGHLFRTEVDLFGIREPICDDCKREGVERPKFTSNELFDRELPQ